MPPKRAQSQALPRNKKPRAGSRGTIENTSCMTTVKTTTQTNSVISKVTTCGILNDEKRLERERKEKEKKDKMDRYFKMIVKALTQNVWYHGLMPRADCEEILKDDGDFLVRKTTLAKVDTFCISVRAGGECKHFPLTFEKLQWRLKGVCKPTLTELIDTHVDEKIPIPPTGALLITAIQRPDYYLLHEHITLGKRLGGGAFGEVFMGSLRKGDVEMEVAVKKLKGQMNKKQLNDFTREAKLMRRFDHKNIVRMYGVAPQEEPIMIVLELAKGGALKDYFKQNDADRARIVDFCKDACRGMCYLSARQIIHRDLAARNCLLGPDPNYDVKISDFGLSLANTNEIKLDKLRNMPIKWLAPETLNKGVFSRKTDVWSFGVLLWEVLTKCKTDPFPGLKNIDARTKILSGKMPMSPPAGSPPSIMAAMELCFTQVTLQLDSIYVYHSLSESGRASGLRCYFQASLTEGGSAWTGLNHPSYKPLKSTLTTKFIHHR